MDKVPKYNRLMASPVGIYRKQTLMNKFRIVYYNDFSEYYLFHNGNEWVVKILYICQIVMKFMIFDQLRPINIFSFSCQHLLFFERLENYLKTHSFFSKIRNAQMSRVPEMVDVLHRGYQLLEIFTISMMYMIHPFRYLAKVSRLNRSMDL